MRGFFAF